MFEIIVDKGIQFINECFNNNEKYHGGFVKGSMAQDNILIFIARLNTKTIMSQQTVVCGINRFFKNM